MSDATDRCEDCVRSTPAPDMKGWLHCSERPAHIYLSAPLAVCKFEPSRFYPTAHIPIETKRR